MKKIVIWGCGSYGERTYKNIAENWKRDYEIVGFADNNKLLIDKSRRGENIFNNLEFPLNDCKIFTADEVKTLYEKKEIDGVFIGIQSNCMYQLVYEQLEEMGVPVECYRTNKSYSVIEQNEPAYRIAKGAIRVYELTDAFVRCDYQDALSVIYDAQQVAVRESVNWNVNLDRCMTFKKPLNTVEEECVLLDKACNLAMDWTAFNYWHLCWETLSIVYAMEENGYEGQYILFESKEAVSVINLLNLGNKVIWINKENEDVIFKIHKLACVEPCRGNTSKMADVIYNFSEALLNCVPVDDKEAAGIYPKRVFFKRIGARKLLGADDIIEKYGFASILPEELSIEDEIKYFRNADIAIVPHGAGMTNCMFMRRNAFFIETFGKEYINPVCVHLLRRKGVNYNMLVENCETADWMSDYRIEDALLSLSIETAINKETKETQQA